MLRNKDYISLLFPKNMDLIIVMLLSNILLDIILFALFIILLFSSGDSKISNNVKEDVKKIKRQIELE